MTPIIILSSMWLVPWPNDNHGKFTGSALQEQAHMVWFASTGHFLNSNHPWPPGIYGSSKKTARTVKNNGQLVVMSGHHHCGLRPGVQDCLPV